MAPRAYAERCEHRLPRAAALLAFVQAFCHISGIDAYFNSWRAHVKFCSLARCSPELRVVCVVWAFMSVTTDGALQCDKPESKHMSAMGCNLHADCVRESIRMYAVPCSISAFAHDHGPRSDEPLFRQY